MKIPVSAWLLRLGHPVAAAAALTCLGLAPITALAQTSRTVSGTVSDETGTGLPGVTVVLKGTTTGASTDAAGKYTIILSTGTGVLRFSSIGYTEQEVAINAQSTVNIKLSAASSALDDVVVVGYGTQRKEDLTGSVASANIEAFRNQPNTNITQSLQGTVPGLNIGQSSAAGDNPSIQVRGATTISGNANVLVVLDGIIFTGALSSLNPDDVASVDVLKDASSTAVYGAQAANGVLLITTRRGRPNQKPRINYSGYYATSRPTVNLRPLNRDEYLQRIKDLTYQQAYLAPDYTTPNPAYNLAANVDPSARDANNQILPNDYDWWGQGTQTGYIQDHQVSISGGSEKTTYLLSGGYNKQRGFIKNDNFNRITARVNLETQVTNWWKLGTQSFASINDYSGAEPSLADLVRASPLLTPYDANGNLIPFPDGTVNPNPFNTYAVDDYDKRLSFFGNFYSDISVPFVKGLNYRTNFGNNYRNDSHFYASKYDAGQTGRAYKDNNFYYESNFDNIITYNHNFHDKHDLTLTLLYSAIKRQYTHTLADATGFSNITLGYNSLQQGAIQRNSSDAYQETLNGQMARLNYKFLDRYLLTATVRRDGFSGFATNNKYGVFPSAAVGWIITNEPFFKQSWVNFLKLRAGYGASGNLTSRYSSLARVSSGAAYVFGDGGTTQFGQQVQTLSNPDLKWESTRGFNLGLDFVVLKNRISGNVDLYNTTTNDLLFDVNIPAITGFQTVRTNVGSVNNKGIEVSLTTSNIASPAFKWSTTFNVSANRNKIVQLVGLDANGDGVEDDLVNSNLFIGRPIQTIYDLQVNGIYQLGDKIPAGFYPGTYRVVDANGDGKFTRLDDRVFIGNQEPAYRFSVLNTFDYKGFTLSAFFNSVQGGKDSYLGANYNGIGSVLSDNSRRYNYFSAIDYWSPSNPNAEYPRSAVGPALAPTVYRSRNFVRLQDVSLTYHFGKAITDKLRSDGLSVFVSGKNLITWTNWKGWDPETGVGLVDNFGAFNNARPVLRSYSAGVNVTF